MDPIKPISWCHQSLPIPTNPLISFLLLGMKYPISSHSSSPHWKRINIYKYHSSHAPKYFSWKLITHEHLNTNQPINPLQRSWLQSWDGPMDVEALSSSKNVAHLQMEPSGWAMIGKYTNSLIANRQTTSCLINHRGDGLIQSVICDSPIHGISAPTSF